MKKRMLHSKRDRGQSFVEFAIGIIMMLTIIMGVVEFGPMLQAWMNVQNSAQEALRFAVTGQQAADPLVDPSDTARLNAIKAVAQSHVGNLWINTSAGESNPGYFHVYVYSSNPPTPGQEFPGGPNTRVSVDVVYNYRSITPFINAIWPWVRLTAHAEAVVERFRFPGYGTPAGVLPATIAPTPTRTPTRTPTLTPVPPTATKTTTPTKTP